MMNEKNESYIMKEIASLMQNKDFLVKFDQCEGLTQFKELLEENGIILSDDEYKRIISSACGENNNELEESHLENVAGGGNVWNYIKSEWKKYWGGFNPFGSYSDAWKAGKKAAKY